jgi:hypothetical protein
MGIVEDAFKGLYPEKEFNYSASIKYSGRFKIYGANVKKIGNCLEFGLSRKWKIVGDDIKTGLIQSLLVKLFGKGASTNNIDLYNIFVKKLHIAVPKDNIDAELEKSFDRVNEKYFFGIIEKPNLRWGSDSLSKLGYYEYQTDTITISSIFRDSPVHLLEYVMYHEMLHKKHKFDVKNGRSYHHTSEFREDEKEFEDWESVEKDLKIFCRRYKRRGMFGFFFKK